MAFSFPVLRLYLPDQRCQLTVLGVGMMKGHYRAGVFLEKNAVPKNRYNGLADMNERQSRSVVTLLSRSTTTTRSSRSKKYTRAACHQLYEVFAVLDA